MRSILLTAALLVSLQGELYAQSYVAKRMSKSKTEQTFNANQEVLSIRDFVQLKNGKMILELATVKDYQNFHNLDSILTGFMNDIVFYKDSLAEHPTSHVRIDYVLNEQYSFKKIRFKRYDADGNIFMNDDGDISKLKFEQDTVRIIVQKSMPGIGGGKSGCMVPITVQATFLIGNYYDIKQIVAEKVLNGIIDTLEQATKQNRRSNWAFQPLTHVYNPYYSGAKLSSYDAILPSEYEGVHTFHRKTRFLSVNANIGAGLIRNTVAPMGDIGIQYNNYWMGTETHNILRLSVTPYYLFEKDGENNLHTYDNWFVNASIGSIYSQASKGWVGKECTFGVGYLVYHKGDYFKNNTFKVFTDILLVDGITIVPEVIMTDNFKQIFPGITVKIF